MGVVLAFPGVGKQGDANDRERVLTSAVIRAADWLDVDQDALAKILSLTVQFVQSMRAGDLHLTENSRAFNRAVDFAAIFTSLHMKFAADRSIARSWMRNANTALNDTPLNLMKKPGGGEAVRAYVERAAIP